MTALLATTGVAGSALAERANTQTHRTHLAHPHADPHGWMPLPLISADNRDAGEPFGGEGGQWVQSLAIDATDGSFLLYGTDVGGLLRSLDGGVTWEPANVGYTPRGAGGAAIDPNFPNRALVLGVNSMPSHRHGIYLSEDHAGSWEHVFPVHMSGVRDIRDQVVFDPQTADHDAGLTRDVYWSRNAYERPIWGKAEPDPAIYRSGDGGRSWSRLPDTQHVGGGTLRADPHTAGRLFTHSFDDGGFYISEDRGETWTLIRNGHFTGLDVSPARPGEVWLTDASTLYRSTDAGNTFTPVQPASDTLARPGYTLRGVEVSPADPDRLVLWRQQDKGWDWTRHVSHDAGQTWSVIQTDNAKAFLPHNNRQGVFAWHPTDPDILVSTGGDWPTRSTDGGKTLQWSGRGFNALLIGGSFQFNPNHPGLVLLASQDYNGAITNDGGVTWRYTNIAGHGWGGFVYGGYAIDPQSMIAADSEAWGGPRHLRITRDGGVTWTSRTDVAYDPSRKAREGDTAPDAAPYGIRISYASPTQPDTWFFAGYRSDDAGQTWSLMDGCVGVFGHAAHNPATLVGLDYDATKDRTHLVLSNDHGTTWTSVLDASGSPQDAAFDAATRTAYLAAGGRLYRDRLDDDEAPVALDTPTDQFGKRRIRSVALDPQNPQIVYAAQNRDVYSVSASAMRSLDGGDTWEALNRNSPLDTDDNRVGLDGGREAYFVRVHPVTREAWFATGCYGNWRHAPPPPAAQP